MAIPLEDNAQMESSAPMQNFNIEVNSSMFSLLTKNIYTDNILAVMREWSTNAIDACIAAELPIKFKVNLPTTLQQTFSVRDYGTGLSETDIAGLFSTLGASTKRGSNAYNGQFGIGRMAGLAYTDSFTVNSYMAGKKLSYLITKKDGIPNMVSLGTFDTDEANGLELSVNVNRHDVTQFERKAAELYEFFDNKPIINIEPKEISTKDLLTGNGWLWNPAYSTFGYSYSRIRVVMGNVAYVVSNDNFNSSLFNLDGFCMHMPLGSVSITPGRESLNFDDKTKQAIKNALVAAEHDLEQVIIASIRTRKDDWSKLIAYKKYYSHLSATGKVNVKKALNLSHPKFYTDNGALKLEIFDNYDLSVFLHGSSQATKTPNISELSVSDNVIFAIADTRIHHKVAVGDIRVDVLTNSNPQNRNLAVIVIKPQSWSKDAADIQKHVDNCTTDLKLLGDVEPYLTSEHTPDVETTDGGTTLKGPVSVLDFHVRNSTSITTTRGSSIKAKMLKGTYYYIRMNAFNCEDPSLTSDQISQYVRGVKIHNESNPDDQINLIGIPKTGMRLIKDVPNFVPLSGAIDAKLGKIQVVDFSTSKLFRHSYTTFSETAKKMTTEEIPEDIKEYFTVSLKFAEDHPLESDRVSTIGLSEAFGATVLKPVCKLTTEDVIEKYPLLQHLLQAGRYSSYLSTELIVDYINTMHKEPTCNSLT